MSFTQGRFNEWVSGQVSGCVSRCVWENCVCSYSSCSCARSWETCHQGICHSGGWLRRRVYAIEQRRILHEVWNTYPPPMRQTHVTLMTLMTHTHTHTRTHTVAVWAGFRFVFKHPHTHPHTNTHTYTQTHTLLNPYCHASSSNLSLWACECLFPHQAWYGRSNMLTFAPPVLVHTATFILLRLISSR